MNAAQVPKDNAISQADTQEPDPDHNDSDFEPADAHAVPLIKLNNRVHKTGRPKLDRKLNEAKDRQDRVVFNASVKAKRDLGEVTLKGLLDSILDERPSVEQTLKRLETIPVKFQEHENKKPKYMRQRNPIVIVDVFYLLPPRLLEVCMKKLPLANSNDDAISVYSQSQSQDHATELSQLNQAERQTNEDDDVRSYQSRTLGCFVATPYK
ncbi:hypothetical protein PINS_up019232 [Pythium insidiosum]|nr:hypothetical protein PINS_up019232 [Pythium insidiosum]